MKALDITKHKTHLTNILLDIYKNSTLSPILGFKGGTAAMLFYKLPRFSVDLDFDLLSQSDGVGDQMTQLLSAKYDIKDYSTKFNTLFWVVSYGLGLAHIKVEISTRDNPYNHYGLLPFYGVTVKTMHIRDMIAHKLVASMERKSIANRDLFDIHYFLSSSYATDINYDIIRHRTGKQPKDFYKSLLEFVSNRDSKKILVGLGEVLTESQKDWAKAKLIGELESLIKKTMHFL
ncbi:MAG: nucleotidyl transferase AbiEii/AbiGii toxin family protein [Candidatus Gottesmanbacteria bacterium]|nr:nucleotidyl transferase AbiEii/AbiGii toxin family protein [Candidatus Gottesmanbacteria bacterium]